MLDIAIILVLIVVLVNTNQSMTRKFGVPAEYRYHLHYLLFYHLFFSLFYTYYILNFGGDSWGYWKFTMEQVVIIDPTWMKYFGVSTTFILWLNYIPSKIMGDRKSTRLNSSHVKTSYAVFCWKKKTRQIGWC